MIKVDISLELVETMMFENSEHQGSVLLLEIKSQMEDFISRGLLRGCKLSLREAFDYAWEELVMETNSLESMSGNY